MTSSATRGNLNAQTPLVQSVVDLYVAKGSQVVQQIHNKSNQWNLSLTYHQPSTSPTVNSSVRWTATTTPGPATVPCLGAVAGGMRCAQQAS